MLSDILGIEDFLGDMDFKVAGTRDGITGFQMDIKIKGVPFDVLRNALQQAREGRMHILDEMDKVLSEPRRTLARWAPASLDHRPEEQDPGHHRHGRKDHPRSAGRPARRSTSTTAVWSIASIEGAGEEALRRIEAIIEEPEIGKIYEGPVKSVTAFGAFVEILPGRDGLVHISELEYRRVEKVEDVLNEGDIVRVKLIGIDNRAVWLSRKALLEARRIWNRSPASARVRGTASGVADGIGAATGVAIAGAGAAGVGATGNADRSSARDQDQREPRRAATCRRGDPGRRRP